MIKTSCLRDTVRPWRRFHLPAHLGSIGNGYGIVLRDYAQPLQLKILQLPGFKFHLAAHAEGYYFCYSSGGTMKICPEQNAYLPFRFATVETAIVVLYLDLFPFCFADSHVYCFVFRISMNLQYNILELCVNSNIVTPFHAGK